MKIFPGVFLLIIILIFPVMASQYQETYEGKNFHILNNQQIEVWIFGPTSMSAEGMGLGLMALVLPENTQGTYTWSIIQGENKAEITWQWGSYVYRTRGNK
ncbi:MAG: hypothetical protein N2115_02700 [bacterium]|nr:hypothetical protein [bacterium]